MHGRQEARRRSWGLGVALLLAAATAQGQSIQIGGTNKLPERETEQRETQYRPDDINYSDCIYNSTGDTFTFTLIPKNYGDNYLEAWSGSSCNDNAARRESSAACSLLYRKKPGATSTYVDVKIRAQDIIEFKLGAEGMGAGTLDTCEKDKSGSTTIFFLFANSNGEMQGTGATYPINYDVVGAEPPTKVSASGQENSLAVSWSISESSGVVEYRLYCEETAGNACTATTLVPGQRPGSKAKECGRTSSSTSTQGWAEGLTNGVNYAVGVVAVNDFENLGKMSALACGVPVPVDDFWDLYKGAGGPGGGKYCSVAWSRPARSAGWGAVLFGLLGAIALRRRSR